MMRLAILLVSLSIFMLGCELVEDSVSSSSGKPSGCPECVGIEEIIKEYEANPIRAEQTYAGNRYNVGGKIERIGKDSAAPPRYMVYIGSNHSMTFAWGERHSWLFELSKGDRIEANCLVTGFSRIYETVQLRECRAAEKPSLSKPTGQ